MAKLTHWRIHSPKPADAEGRAAKMASRAELVAMLAPFNIGPEDGSPEAEVLHGPGVRMHLPFEDPVRQILVEEDDDSIAPFVLMALPHSMPRPPRKRLGASPRLTWIWLLVR